MAKQAKGVLKAETLKAVADRGYFSSPENLACHEAGITVTLPKPQTSGAKSEGRFGKQSPSLGVGIGKSQAWLMSQSPGSTF